MINYYHRFVPRFAETLAPLNVFSTQLAKDKIKDIDFWPTECISSFISAKQSIVNATVLSHPDYNDNVILALTVDCSNLSMGAVLEQRSDNLTTPLAFFSRKLNDAQKRYSVFDRELLSLYSSIKHFRFLLEGRHFICYTDHKPLVRALFTKTEKTPRQTRHLEFIAQFTNDIRHLSGKDNVIADALSRIDDVSSVQLHSFPSTFVSTISEHFSLKALISAQLKDRELTSLINSQSNSSKRSKYY